MPTEPLCQILNVRRRRRESDEASVRPQGLHARDDDLENSSANVETDKVAFVEAAIAQSASSGEGKKLKGAHQKRPSFASTFSWTCLQTVISKPARPSSSTTHHLLVIASNFSGVVTMTFAFPTSLSVPAPDVESPVNSITSHPSRPNLAFQSFARSEQSAFVGAM